MNLNDNHSNTSDIAVSVFCLAFNHEKYIRQALEGFVMQKTNFRYEVFVHDDASTDNTAEIIKEYAEKYPDIIKPVFQKENQYSQKIPIIPTYILPKMNGRYIASCEGDDYWNDPMKLQRQFDALENHPECSIAVHKVQCCNEDGSPDNRVFPNECYELDNDKLLTTEEFAECLWIKGDYPFHTSSYFYRASVLNEKIVLRRDIGLLKKCLIQGTAYYINTPMSTRRLMSIGGFNYNLKKNGISSYLKLFESNIDNDIIFDEYTNYKFHSYIEYRFFLSIMSMAVNAPYDMREYLKKFDLSYKNIFKRFSLPQKLKMGLKLTMLKVCPKLLKSIGNHKNK